MGLSLAKEQTKVLSLKKSLNNGKDFKMQVVLMQDVSGSMSDEFRGSTNSLMESVLQRVLAFASQVDPDGQVEIVAFSSRAHYIGNMDIGMFDNATDSFLQAAKPVLWGGTDYGCAFECYKKNAGSTKSIVTKTVLQEQAPKGMFGAIKGLFGAKETVEVQVQEEVVVAGVKDANHPTLIVFITDGEDFGNKDRFLNALKEQVNEGNTFVLLLGAGNEPTDFRLLEHADRQLEGVSFVSAKGVKDLNNDEFYSKLMTKELDTFLKGYYK